MREADELAWARYERTMNSRGLSWETKTGARRALENLSRALPDGVTLFTAAPGDVEEWLSGLHTARLASGAPRYSQTTHATYWRRAHAFYAWAEDREYITRSPMARLPKVVEHEKVIPIPDAGHMAAVLAACRGKEWKDRRDLAMLRLLLEAGTPRAFELAGLTTAGLDMRRDRITVAGKGGKERVIPFGEKTGQAMMLWLRARASCRLAELPVVFFTKYGRMDRGSVYKIIAARCQLAGVPVIPPHHWRHWSAHEWLRNGGSEGDAMALFGWADPAMARRYARAAEASRAIDHAAARAQGDQL